MGTKITQNNPDLTIVPDFDDTTTSSRSGAKITPDSTSFLPSTAAHTPSNPSGSSAPRSGKAYLWSIQFYAHYFDIDTADILNRCVSTIYPRQNFLDVLDGNPDLYGPFWIATTVVVILFLTGTISQYLAQHHDKHFEYDFKLLSGAAGLIYGYTAFVPIALWAALKWFGASGSDLVECWALYGYSNLVWIAVALLSWSPLTPLNYAIVAVGFGWSVFFLLRNLWPVLTSTEKKTGKMLLVAVVVLHAALAVAIKVLFFA